MRTALLVDNDPLICESLTYFLQDEGFQVLQAKTTNEALKQIKKNVDLVICDLELRQSSNMDFLQKIKEEDASKLVPCIVLSAMDDPELAVKALQLGAWDYIVKPITDFTSLQRSITLALEKAGLVAENERYKFALENANQKLTDSLAKLQEDQTAGKLVQMKLLPKNDMQIQDLTFSYFVEPSLYLSGDFVDYIKLDDRYTCCYVIDVSGHGSSSAFVTVYMKTLISQHVSDYYNGNTALLQAPDKFLLALNQQICQQALGKYATMIYLLFDHKLNMLHYSSGGHYPYPILCDLQQSTAEFIKFRGFPVGLYSRATFVSYSLQLPEQYYLVLLTDGILDMMQEDDLVAKEKKLLQLLTLQQPNIAAIKQILLPEPHLDCPDDIACLLILKNNGGAAHAAK